MLATSPNPTTNRLARLSASPLWRIAASVLIVLTGLAMQVVTANSTQALSLGNGKYELTGSVFGTDLDGLVGQETSNGRRVRPFDRLIALPACTESSCPWLPISAEAGDEFGAQTLCAEADGLCWVQVISPETGDCAVAPVLDRGPLFVRDNWWFPKNQRTYRYSRGLPAAEIAETGVDLGFGAGMSDSGFDIANDYTYAAAIDLGAGTWVDLGLDPDQGVGDLEVKLLWQAGVNHEDACDGTYGNAVTTDSVNLRSGPSTDDEIQTVLNSGQRLSITGSSQNDFYLVDVNGDRGWVFKDYLKPDGGHAGDPVGFVTDEVNFRAGPSTSDDVYQVVPEGSIAVVDGNEENGFIPVIFRGQSGWISSDYLDLGNTSGDNSGGGGDSNGSAVTTDSVNFRSSPDLSASIIKVLSPGTTVTLNNDEQNGFMAVTFGGFDGWIFAEFLMVEDGGGGGIGDTMTVTENLNLRAGPSTADTILQVMPAGATVTITGDPENGFLPVTYKGKDGWAFAQYLE